MIWEMGTVHSAHSGSAYLVGGVRTPVGRYAGALSTVRSDDLAALVLHSLVERLAIDPREIDDVILGAANQSGEDNRNLARMAALLAQLGDSVPGQTVNRLCASGLQAIASAGAVVKSGEADLILAGGAESMSRAPWVTAKPLAPFAKPTEVFDTALGWRFVNPKMRTLDDGDATLSLGECTEKLAELYGITRNQADYFAARSHERATQAWAAGNFDREVIEIPVVTKTGTTLVRTDETVRSDTTFDKLQSLKPSFRPNGVTTAGNASPLSDGASGIVVASEKSIAEHGWTPRARIASYAVAGVAPSLFGLGPVPAIRKLLERTGLSLQDIGVIEINEAFAAQVLACTTELEIDPQRINVSGGGISLGHPLGSSGSRLVLNALGELERTGERFAVVSLCIGVGQGAAMLIEREDST